MEENSVRPYMRVVPTMCLLAAGLLCLAGCDGEGLFVVKNVSSGDQPPDQDDPTPNPEPPDGTTDTRFSGTWVGSYGDDFVTALTARGMNEYATVLRLTQQNATVTGSGTMYRFVRQGTVAWERLNFTVVGTAAGSDATLTLKPAASGSFDAFPVWNVRLSGQRLVGMFQETRSGDGSLIRAGHGEFLRTASGAVDGPWVATMSDRFSTGGESREDRTGSMTLTRGTDSALTGQGVFDVQTDAAASSAEFNVTRGAISNQDVSFSFGELDLLGAPMDWLGFVAGPAIVGAYAQFDSSTPARLTRLGHATWYRAQEEPSPNAISYGWVTSFADAATAGNVPAQDYLMRVVLQAQDGGGVTGSGTLRSVGDTSIQESLTVTEGNLLGSNLHLELRGTGRTFYWDLRVAGALLVGSYRQVNVAGNFVSRGTGVWRIGTGANLVGSWATAYYDTFGAADVENTQMALVTISRQETTGALAGFGALRYAGETQRRLFNMDGNAAEDEIVWVWRSQDLFGLTVWRLRQAGNILYGTYENEDSAGNLEYRGNALWVRTNQTGTITQ